MVVTLASSKSPIPGRIVNLFIDQDRKRSELYSLFAGRFPEHRQLWDRMARDGRSRAEYLKALLEKMESGEVTFTESRTKTYTLRSFIEFLDGIIEKTVRNQMTVPGALSLTLDIERSNIGSKVFDHFTGNSDGAERYLRRLRTEGDGPRETADRLKELLKRYREPGPT